MSLDPFDLATRTDFPTAPSAAGDAGPLGELPQLSSRQVRLQERLSRTASGSAIASALAWLIDSVAANLRIDQPEVLWTAAGLGRPGVIALFSWPRLGSRFALGIETPVAHAVVDRLLGFDRLPAGSRLQITPVEWGILAFVLAETLARLEDRPRALGPWDFTLERVSPDPFTPAGLGSIVTLRWAVQIGPIGGSVRLWMPEAIIALWLASEPTPESALSLDLCQVRERFGELSGLWRAEAGTIQMPRGLGKLRVGGVLPIADARLRGTPQSPAGSVELCLSDRAGRSWFQAEPVSSSGGSRVTLTAPLRRRPVTREALIVDAPRDPAQAPPQTPPSASPADVPVTLAVELGRINLPLRRLADLKPGDVVELGRHAREPVELTSGGRLIARGELVQIDTELGVRVLSVFL